MSLWIDWKSNISPKIKQWEHYCLFGLELLMKSGYFTYGKNEFLLQPIYSSKWTWIDQELKIVYLGMGIEFYLKGLYLKKSFSIQQVNNKLIYPINVAKIKPDKLFREQNVSFDHMIQDDNLSLILDKKEVKQVLGGLKIIQKWRNVVVHSIRLNRTESGEQLYLITDSVNILHNHLIKSEKRLIKNINKIIEPWLKDRFHHGRFIEKGSVSKERKMIFDFPRSH